MTALQWAILEAAKALRDDINNRKLQHLLNALIREEKAK